MVSVQKINFLFKVSVSYYVLKDLLGIHMIIVFTYVLGWQCGVSTDSCLLHRLTLVKGVYSFRYFLHPMRIPNLLMHVFITPNPFVICSSCSCKHAFCLRIAIRHSMHIPGIIAVKMHTCTCMSRQPYDFIKMHHQIWYTHWMEEVPEWVYTFWKCKHVTTLTKKS